MVENLTGRKIGQYELAEVIGRGGMAVVYRARQPRVQRDVAIKIITEPYAHHSAFVHRFEREARASAWLQHPHILPVYDVGIESGQPYLVMAYLPGGTLSHRIAIHRGGLPLADIVSVMLQVASALDYAHRQGIIHRDIKPSNILLDEQNHAYLSDFGIAQLAAEASKSALPLGTYEYMAPEVAEGGLSSPASDIYSLGVTLFEMLTGRRPFYAPDRAALIQAHAEENVPNIQRFRSGLPPGVRVVVEQALIKDPAARPPHASALAQTLARAAGMEALATAGIDADTEHDMLMPDDLFDDLSTAAPDGLQLLAPLTPPPEIDDPDTDPVALLPSPSGQGPLSSGDIWFAGEGNFMADDFLNHPSREARQQYSRSAQLRIPLWLISSVILLMMCTLCVLVVFSLTQLPGA